jgi:hypothetical protein
MTYCITFASDHPAANHWVEVEAEDELEARRIAFKNFGSKWSMIYLRENFNSPYFPAGKLGETITR